MPKKPTSNNPPKFEQKFLRWFAKFDFLGFFLFVPVLAYLFDIPLLMNIIAAAVAVFIVYTLIKQFTMFRKWSHMKNPKKKGYSQGGADPIDPEPKLSLEASNKRKNIKLAEIAIGVLVVAFLVLKSISLLLPLKFRDPLIDGIVILIAATGFVVTLTKKSPVSETTKGGKRDNHGGKAISVGIFGAVFSIGLTHLLGSVLHASMPNVAEALTVASTVLTAVTVVLLLAKVVQLVVFKFQKHKDTMASVASDPVGAATHAATTNTAARRAFRETLEKEAAQAAKDGIKNIFG